MSKKRTLLQYGSEEIDEPHYYNLGKNIEDKFTKLSKVAFCMDCFTANFMEFLSTIVKVLFLDNWLDINSNNFADFL